MTEEQIAQALAAGIDPKDLGLPSSIQDEFGPGQHFTSELLDDIILDELTANAEALGYSEQAIVAWYGQHRVNMLSYIQDEVIPSFRETTGMPWDGSGSPMEFEVLKKFARNYLVGTDSSGNIHKIFNPNLANAQDKSGRRGGGGGRGLSPADIRAQFDLDQLAMAVKNQWQGLLFDEPKNARAVAKAYVDAVVKNPDQKLDFNTFVRGHIQKQPRYNMIYKNKPRGMSEEAYFQPYVAAASQYLRPNDVRDAATGAAQLGSSQQTFRERMSRDNAVTTSAPFISSFEKRMQDVAGVFKG